MIKQKIKALLFKTTIYLYIFIMKNKKLISAGVILGLLIFLVYEGVGFVHNSKTNYYSDSRVVAMQKQLDHLQEAASLGASGEESDASLVPSQQTNPGQTEVLGAYSSQSLSATAMPCKNNQVQVFLSWTALTRISGYYVERKPSGAPDSAWVALSPKLSSSIFSYTDNAVPAGTWIYQVRSLSTSKKITYSNEAPVSVPFCTTSVATVPASTPETVAPPPPSGTPAVVTTSSLKWGAYNGWEDNALAGFETTVGKQADMQAVFVGWGSNGQFPSSVGSVLKPQGKTLVIFWEPSNGSTDIITQPDYNYDSITSGKWDSYLTSFAASAKTYGGDVILVPFEEMNGDWYPWSGVNNGNSPEKSAAAFRYLRKFFTNVSNVKFAWAPNSTSWPSVASNAITKYYPGSDVVDIIGLDGFNFGSPWQTFAEIFGPAVSEVKSFGKPIYAISMASTAGTGKAAWITDAITQQMPKLGISGFVWFNTNKERDWRVNSDSASLAAFTAAVN